MCNWTIVCFKSNYFMFHLSTSGCSRLMCAMSMLSGLSIIIDSCVCAIVDLISPLRGE